MRRFGRKRAKAMAMSARYLAVFLFLATACGGRTSTNASTDGKASTPAGDGAAGHGGSGHDTTPVDDGGTANSDSGAGKGGSDNGYIAEGGAGGHDALDGGADPSDAGADGTAHDSGITDSGIGIMDGGADGGRVTGYPEGEGPPWSWGKLCMTNPYSQGPCPTTDWCHDRSRLCAINTFGTCVTRPKTCGSVCPGVCGCDSRFYCNECLANAAGVDVWKDGMCP